MNNFLCSLLCTCMTIIDFYFMLLAAYLETFMEVYCYIASCVVVNDDIMRAMKMFRVWSYVCGREFCIIHVSSFARILPRKRVCTICICLDM